MFFGHTYVIIIERDKKKKKRKNSSSVPLRKEREDGVPD